MLLWPQQVPGTYGGVPQKFVAQTVEASRRVAPPRFSLAPPRGEMLRIGEAAAGLDADASDVEILQVLQGTESGSDDDAAEIGAPKLTLPEWDARASEVPRLVDIAERVLSEQTVRRELPEIVALNNFYGI